MVIDQTSILGISDLNPIQFWPPDKPTFNQKKIPRIDKQYFWQLFNFNETLYNRLDVAFSSARYHNYDSAVSYSIGDKVYDPITLLRWSSVTNTNVGNTPQADTSFTNWTPDPWVVPNPVFDMVTSFAAGARVLALGQAFLNHDFAGNITGWNGNYNVAGSVGGQTWTYDGTSGGAKCTFNVSGFPVITKGLAQAITVSTDGKYSVRVKGSVASSSYPGTIVIRAYFYDISGTLIGSDILVTIGADGAFDTTTAIIHAGVVTVALSATMDGGASISVIGSVIVTEFDCYTAPYKCYQSLIDVNVGNQPSDNPADWDQVTQANGQYVLNFVVPTDPGQYDETHIYNIGERVVFKYRIYASLINGNADNTPDEVGGISWLMTDNHTIEFDNIRVGSTHQAVSFLWSDFPYTEDARILLLIADVQNEVTLANSDCIDIQNLDDTSPGVVVQYSNSNDYAGILFDTINAQFYIRLIAHFYEESEVLDNEDQNLSNGSIVSLRTQMITKRLLLLIDALPDYIHKKIQLILTRDNVMIDDLPWKLMDTYDNGKIPTSMLSFAQVLLTQADSVLTGLTKYDGSTTRFSSEFTSQFS